MNIDFVLNGKKQFVQCRDDKSLAELLREDFGLLGTKIGCGKGECGACTVIVDGLSVTSCIYPAAKINGKSVTTIEGLATEKSVSPIQQAFIDAGAVQCGFCTPGMVMSAKALLDKNLHPDETEIRRAMSGNICRCTGYVKIIEAVKLAAEYLEKENCQ